MNEIPLAVSVYLFLELCVVTYFDIKNKKISNLWPIAHIGLFILCLFLFPTAYYFSWASLQFPLLFLSVGYILFLFNIMGAGDVKYLATFLLLLPPSLQSVWSYDLMSITAMAGSCLLMMKVFKNFDKMVLACTLKDFSYLKVLRGTKFVYAPIMLVAYVWFVIESRSKIF